MSKMKPRIIKRYHNRKLYDTRDSCYVTLEEIQDMIQSGEDIQVRDNNTNNDLTSVTLAQIIFEAEKKQKNLFPIATLLSMVRSHGASLREFVHKSIETGAREISLVRDDVGEFVDRLVHVGKVSHEDRGSVMSTIRTFLDKKVLPTVTNVHNIPSVQSELKTLQQRIADLERKVTPSKPTKPTR